MINRKWEQTLIVYTGRNWWRVFEKAQFAYHWAVSSQLAFTLSVEIHKSAMLQSITQDDYKHNFTEALQIYTTAWIWPLSFLETYSFKLSFSGLFTKYYLTCSALVSSMAQCARERTTLTLCTVIPCWKEAVPALPCKHRASQNKVHSDRR